MDYSDDSDIDSIVTPINPPEISPHGQMLESDSLSDFYLQEATRKHKAKHKHRRRRREDDLDGSFEEDEARAMDIPEAGQGNLKEIYRELQVISEKLKEENRMLHEREQSVKERERMVSISQENVKTVVELEIRQKLQAIEERHSAEIARLEHTLKEKFKENKRLKDNFETLKQANDAQKREFETLKAQHEKLEKQSTSLQARLTNLQRRQDFAQRQKDPEASLSTSVPKQKSAGETEDKSKQSRPSKPATSGNTFEVMSVLLDWICDAHLRYTVSDSPFKQLDHRSMSAEFIQEKVLKILPSLVDLVKEYPSQNIKLCLPCLQFIYWSLVHVEQAQGTQKSNMSSTFRRLGEEMYRSKSVRFSEADVGEMSLSPVKQEKQKDGVFFKSGNLHTRLLSSLIILKTLSQVDLLAHVFDVLRNDLKSDVAKELYLYYQATPVIVQYLKPVNKAFMGPAMDIFLQMSTETPFLQPFLESCSNENWFRTIAMVLRSPRQDTKLLERLSIVLQKLSKLKSNKRYFEVYTITGIVQELLRTCNNDQAFLALNLKSVLYNINSGTG